MLTPQHCDTPGDPGHSLRPSSPPEGRPSPGKAPRCRPAALLQAPAASVRPPGPRPPEAGGVRGGGGSFRAESPRKPRDLRVRIRTLRSTTHRGVRGRQAGAEDRRKCWAAAGCSSHASRYRIPQRSRQDHRERFLLAPSRPRSPRMLRLPRRAASRGLRAAASPGFPWSPTKASDAGRLEPPAGRRDRSGRELGAGPPGFPGRRGTLLGHAGFTREGGCVSGLC